MDPSEIEFIAEKEVVTIVPNFNLDKIYLIGGDVGPLAAGLPVEVPLWMAVMLKQRLKCRIIPPSWMDVEFLEQKKQEEKDSSLFTQMPSPHYMEIAQTIFKYASESLAKSDEIRTLIKDIWDSRIAKLRSSIDIFISSEASHAKLNHLTLLELNTVRPILPKALECMKYLSNSAYNQLANSQEDSQT